MGKKIRISLIVLLTLLMSLLVQFVVQNLDYSFLIISTLLLFYYFLILRLKIWIKEIDIFSQRLYDKIRGLDITKTETLEDLGISVNNGYIYEGTITRHIKPFFKEHMNLFSLNEKIIDLGCGKGSALITFKKIGFKSVAGVEISDKLCLIAKHNLQKLKIYDVEIFNSDILDFDSFEDFDIFYMFNPFPAEIINKVVLSIEQSLVKKPRIIKIIYMNPKHHAEIDKSKLFKRLGEFNYDSEKSIFRNIFIYKN